MEKNAPLGVVIVAALMIVATLCFLGKMVYDDSILLRTNTDLPSHWKRYLKNEIKIASAGICAIIFCAGLLFFM